MRIDQRIHARRLTQEDLQVTWPILFSSGTGSLAMNKAWQAAALTAATPAGLAQAARPGRHPYQGRAEDPAHRILHAAARLTRAGRRRRLNIQATWP
jgi:hypothetical protein